MNRRVVYVGLNLKMPPWGQYIGKEATLDREVLDSAYITFDDGQKLCCSVSSVRLIDSPSTGIET